MNLRPTEKIMLRELYDSNKRIESALFGDKEANIEGHFEKVKRHEKQINRHNKALWVFTGALLAFEALKTFFKEHI